MPFHPGRPLPAPTLHGMSTQMKGEATPTVGLMTPREQAEAAWTPTSPYSVDELEQMIRADRRMDGSR